MKSRHSFGNNSEKNSEISQILTGIIEFCPKSVNLLPGTVNNSELAVNFDC
jgi:hypothetical protein